MIAADAIVISLAQESTGDAPLMTKVMSYMELIITVAVVVTNAGLWWITALVHRDETKRLSEMTTNTVDHLADANDNITDVALAEIDAHHRNAYRMRELSHARRRTIRTTRRALVTRKPLS